MLTFRKISADVSNILQKYFRSDTEEFHTGEIIQEKQRKQGRIQGVFVFRTPTTSQCDCCDTKQFYSGLNKHVQIYGTPNCMERQIDINLNQKALQLIRELIH